MTKSKIVFLVVPTLFILDKFSIKEMKFLTAKFIMKFVR